MAITAKLLHVDLTNRETRTADLVAQHLRSLVGEAVPPVLPSAVKRNRRGDDFEHG